MIASEICQMIGIKYPIFQGGMAWISDARLAAAVSNAGGLGIIACGFEKVDKVAEQIKLAKTLTDKPFGMNIMLMSRYVDELVELVVKEKVAVVTTGAGNPAKYTKPMTDAGILVIPVTASTGMARNAERNGACAVVAEGTESGGHIGELATMALIPQVKDAVKIPVIAAGGIADGRGIAAAMMLGAVGAQLGTRFLVAKECSAHQNYKDKVLNAKDIDTVSTGKRLGHPIRALKTPFSLDLLSKEYDSSVSNEELEDMDKGALRLAVDEGDLQHGCFLAGQIAGLVNREQSAAEIISELVAETEATLRSAASLVVEGDSL